MKKTVQRILSLLLLGVPLLAADARISPDERARLLKWLEESRKEFLSAIDGVSEPQWKWKPAPGRWSVGEVAVCLRRRRSSAM